MSRARGAAAAEAALLGAAAWLYARTMAPAIAVGDAGELALAARVVGIPHPPGYPLFTLLGRLASLAPLQPVAWRFNMLSIACAVGALALHLAIGRRLGLGLAPRLAATALLAGSASFWSQAYVPEVYTLFLLLAHAVLFAALGAGAGGSPAGSSPAGGSLASGASASGALLLAYLAGLALAHHPSGILLVPVAAAALVGARRAGALPSRGGLLAAGALFLVPFTLFLVLPIRSRLEPAIDWGNPETLSALIAHATRSRYGDLGRFARPLGVLAGQAAAFARTLADDLSLPVALGVPAGLALLARRAGGRLAVLFFLLFSAGTILLVNFRLDAAALYDNRVFFLPAVSAAALAAGVLFQRAQEAISGRRVDPAEGEPAGAPAAARGPRRLAAAGAGAAALLLAVAPGAARIPRMDHRDHTVGEDLGRALLIPIDPGATLLASEGQAVHSLAYVSGVLGFRPDVRVVDRLGVLGGGRGLGGGALPDGRARSEALFATEPAVLRARGLAPIPWGLAYRGGSPETAVGPGLWETLSFRRPERVESIDFAERDVLVEAYARMARHVAWAGLRVRGESAIDEARRLAGDEDRGRFAATFGEAYEAVGLPDSAIAFWRAAASADPRDASAPRRAGLLLGRAGRWGESREALEESSRRAPADAAILVELGSARFALGDSAAAASAWRAALAADPANAEAARGLSLLR